jgi:hypothetical protein
VLADAGHGGWRRRLPPGPERARPAVGRGHPQGAERVLDRGRAALAAGGHGPAAQAPRACRARTRSRPAEAALAGAGWHRISWRRGTEGSLAAAFAALRAGAPGRGGGPAEGAQLRDGRHLPGEEVWSVGERRASGERRACGERKHHLSNLPPTRPWRSSPPRPRPAGCASRRASS